ncbi:DSBA-like thioredoxin domain-containing protein [Parachaetomium inaequale]|uniref:DSBA-like thioredoxin domain-containing protein n=1 Tax=Parachaetomium inaequale TaxID=2588326 RepID=A0AAN6P899_9PEZI|nr:DSBA-like thioredoxin domain-containing protein [Parachaetomium inaequale]
MTNFAIDIISDNCYIGKEILDKAIELYKKVYPGGKDDTFTISWSAYYLDETSPQQGVPLLQRMAERFGADRVAALQERLRGFGAQEGIDFSFAGKLGNTRDSHRLIHLGKTKGNEVENRVVMELFGDYFEGMGDITSYETLIKVGVKAGIEESEAREWLESGKGGDEVDAEVREARSRGIRGVPHYIIQGKYEVGGTQDPQQLMEVFAQVKEEQQRS